jgi:ketosteroid isomerase-like protein
MVRAVCGILVLVVASRMAIRQDYAAPDPAVSGELTAMLRQFLADASTNNAAGFDRFFADDVIYTRSTGAVVTKADIMKSVSAAPAAPGAKVTYSAEDVILHTYPDAAISNFRLVGRTQYSDGRIEEAYYRNTGVFLRRNGRWQAVAWQSTRLPEQPLTPPSAR